MSLLGNPSDHALKLAKDIMSSQKYGGDDDGAMDDGDTTFVADTVLGGGSGSGSANDKYGWLLDKMSAKQKKRLMIAGGVTLAVLVLGAAVTAGVIAYKKKHPKPLQQ